MTKNLSKSEMIMTFFRDLVSARKPQYGASNKDGMIFIIILIDIAIADPVN